MSDPTPQAEGWADRVEALLARLGVGPGAPHAKDARALVARAVELGATDDEILAAGRVGHLGPLALDLALRPPGDTLSLDAFVESCGAHADLARRLWVALGLPASDEFPLAVPPDAAEAVRILLFVADQLGEDTTLGLARVLGSAAGRIADELANVSRIGMEVPQLDTGVAYADVADQMRVAARDLLPVMWDAAGAVFRRHLVLVSHQPWRADEARRAVTTDRAVGFVDLVGSTEVLRTRSVSDLVTAVDHFEQQVWDVVARGGGRVVKLLGDEAMFTVGDPAAACRIARALLAESDEPVRVGMAQGEIVAYHGDCYGPTVNLAARLVDVARPGSALVSEELAASVAGEVDVAPVDTGPLRGFPEITTAYELSAGG